MTLSPLVESKLERRFRTYDLDRDGVVTRADFELVSSRVEKTFGLAPDHPAATRLREVLLGIWTRLAAASDVDRDDQVTLAEYKAAFERHVLVDREAYSRAYQPFIDTMMEIADADGDGRVTEGEYVKWYTALMGLPPDEAAEAFRHLDRDGDGYLGHEEITAAVLEFYFSDDPDAPGNWMVGRPPGA
ncbi:EF-hand domain-containing protein [Saccharothrix obliqua]|uniref:EF-hand domain-containing protein n=1 Tax=Saccharothrix obliqua TaxID=2861747 RepID=UPI001C5CE642|nr:EF-hand domain-containing protein [Saccharothrix obliqua]MBW4720313.1 EF-hand domain-containing protein [Saccharothrix obliqua]